MAPTEIHLVHNIPSDPHDPGVVVMVPETPGVYRLEVTVPDEGSEAFTAELVRVRRRGKQS